MVEVPVKETTDVATARRAMAAATDRLGFGEVQAARAALVTSELATNLLKHGDGGRLLLEAGDEGVDLLAIDKGVGMVDARACLADGFSTAGTLGQGLGAVRRASERFEMLSWPDKGTVVFAHVARTKASRAHDATIAAVVVPIPGETACGDAWSYRDSDEGRTVFVVDGLGHGTDAAIAAHAAVKQFERSSAQPLDQIVQGVHQAMRVTRGGAIGVARIDWASQTISFAGLGNIAAAAASQRGPLRRMVSLNGTAGHNARKIQTFEYPCGDGQLIMHSDGISTSWLPERYPGLLHAHPMLVAGVLYRDHGRGRDDALVVVSSTVRPSTP